MDSKYDKGRDLDELMIGEGIRKINMYDSLTFLLHQTFKSDKSEMTLKEWLTSKNIEFH